MTRKARQVVDLPRGLSFMFLLDTLRKSDDGFETEHNLGVEGNCTCTLINITM